MNISTESLLSLAKLRPPFARSALLVVPYSQEGNANPGITVEMVVGEPAIAPGTGIVRRIYGALPRWVFSDNTLATTAVKHIEIEHGNGVTTVVGGLSTVDVILGQTVYRGDRLGTLLTNQLFISVILGKKTLNPVMLNKHWFPQNGNVVSGQGGRIRFAPDRLARDLSHGVSAVLHSGIVYFKQLLTPTPFLINIAFNGDGSKTGLAATGYDTTDYWNVYTPSDFYATIAYSCYYSYGYSYGTSFYDFSDAPVLCLRTYQNESSPVLLERVAPLFSAAGTAASWDNMLKRWIGGYLGPVPYENTFRLRNLPAGNFNLFLYANQGAFPMASTFYVSVNAGLPTSQTNNPIVTPVFVEGSNYVKYALVIPANGYITIKAVGYLSGLQLQRT
jgi:hypothetical protein